MRTRSLRIIDLGAAVELEQNHADCGPASELYCPPEQLIPGGELRASYDIYSAAIIWLRFVVPKFGASRKDLWRFLGEVRDVRHSRGGEGHCLDSTLSDATANQGFFAGSGCLTRSEDGARAQELLRAMMAWDPVHRVSASEALRASYLAHDYEAPDPKGGALEDCRSDFSCAF